MARGPGIGSFMRLPGVSVPCGSRRPSDSCHTAPRRTGGRLGVSRRVDDLPLTVEPRQDAPADFAIQLGEDIVQQQDGTEPAASAGDDRHRQAQREGQEPLLAARGGAPRVGAPEPDRHVVAMRPDEREPPAQLMRAGCRQGRPAAPPAWPPDPPRRDRGLVAQRHAGRRRAPARA